MLDLYLVWDGTGIKWPVAASGLWTSLAIGITMGLGSLTLFAAYWRGKASIISPYSQLYPIITVLVAVPVYHERIDMWRGLGVGAALAAGIVLSFEKGAAIGVPDTIAQRTPNA